MEASSRQGIVIAPAGLGEVLDLGFNLARRNFRLLVQIVAWGMVPGYVGFFLISLATTQASSGSAGPILLVGVGFVVFMVGLFLGEIAGALAVARLIHPTGDRDDLATGSLYGAAAGSLGRLILLGIIWGLAAIPLAIVFPLGIYIWVRWSMSWLTAVIEGAGPLASLGRSWELTRGSWWHTFGVVVVASLIIGLLSSAVGFVFGAVGGIVGFATGSPTVSAVLNALASAISSIVLTPFSMAIYVVLYFELRARTEGFDLEQRAQQVAPSE